MSVICCSEHGFGSAVVSRSLLVVKHVCGICCREQVVAGRYSTHVSKSTDLIVHKSMFGPSSVLMVVGT